jgi:MFS family permease
MTLESAPTQWRGVPSGLLRGGYPLGYLLAAVTARVILPERGWRPMFWTDTLPAIVTMYLAYKSSEPEAWRQNRSSSVGEVFQVVWKHRKSFACLVDREAACSPTRSHILICWPKGKS